MTRSCVVRYSFKRSGLQLGVGGLRLLGTSTAMRGISQFQIRIVRERREGQLKGIEAENH